MNDCEKKTFLVSDAHLGSGEPSLEETKRQCLISFFDHVRETGDRLVILGDLFDFWFEYRSMIDASHFPVLAGLWQMRNSGVRIDYYLGNHDYWTSGFFLRELATEVHRSPRDEMFGSKRALLAHGDGLTGDEKSYLFMRRILRHPYSRVAFRLLHPDIGAWLARRTSKASRRQLEQKRDRSSAILREFARRGLESGRYDWIIVGHSHQPEIHRYGDGVYLNIGDWSEHNTYGLIDGEKISLETWKAPDALNRRADEGTESISR